MTFFRTAFCLLLATLALAGCSTGPKADIAYAPADFRAPDSIPVEDYLSAAYRVLPQDEVNVAVFRVPDLSGTYKVSNGGQLNLPLIGTVDAAGFTEVELARVLESRYGARYLQNPSIQVTVKSPQAEKLVMEGAVRDPGSYPIQGRTSLLEAIALANGLDPDTANPGRIVIIREIGGETYRAAFDLRQVREGLMPNPRVYGGDIVVVDGSNLRRTYSDIIRTIPIVALFVRAL